MEQLQADQRRTYNATPLLLMIVCGLATTAAALVGVWYVEKRFHESVMTWSLYFIPIGALIVGVVAASGYGLAAVILHIRLPKHAVWLFAGLQVLAYFAAQYVQFKSRDLVYRDTLQPVGFWEYFHLIATSYSLEHDIGAPTPLGPAGYLIKLAEIAAFAASAAGVTLVMGSGPYCTACRRYRRTKQLATIYARHFTPADEAVDEADVLAGGHAAFDGLATIAQAGAADVFAEQIREHPPLRQSSNLPSRLQISLDYCPRCMAASLCGLVVVKRPATSTSEPAEARPVPPQFAEQLIRGR